MFAIVVACVAVALGSGGPILGIHRVHEGCVGVYWKGGALLDTISRPGYHAMFPGVTKTANLQGKELLQMFYSVSIFDSLSQDVYRAEYSMWNIQWHCSALCKD